MQDNTIQHIIVYNTTQDNKPDQCNTKHNTTQYKTIKHITQYNTIQYNT